MRSNTYNNGRTQRPARRQVRTPRASGFEAFSTRCGKPASSLEVTKYLPMIADTTLINDYILNYITPTPDRQIQVTTWDDLKNAFEAAIGDEVLEIVVMNDIIVPAGYVRAYLNDTPNQTIIIRSNTGQYTIDFDYVGEQFLRWDNSSDNNTKLILSDIRITHFQTAATGSTTQSIAFIIYTTNLFVNNFFIEDCNISNEVFGLNGSVLMRYHACFTNCLAKNLFSDPSLALTHPAGLLHSFNCDILFYNCAFEDNVANNQAGITADNGAHVNLFAFQIVVMGCLFDNNTASVDPAFRCNTVDGNTYIINSVFKDNETTTNRSACDISIAPQISSEQVNAYIFDAEFVGNKSGNNGSAVNIADGRNIPNNPNVDKLHIGGDTCFIDNITLGNSGGAIAVSLINLVENSWITIEPSVIFSGNRAANAYYLLDSDKVAYEVNVKSQTFSEHFQYGWNNYDIEYTGGKLIQQTTVPVDQCTQDFTTNNIGQIIPFPMIDPSCVPPMQMFKGWFKDAAHTIPVSDYTIFFSGDVLYPLFVPEPDCLCCDCLNDELKNAFEMLTVSVGGTHDAAGYILQVIADKLTDPANTCELSDFQNILDELTKLTGYNQKEICCILSAMTGMEVG